MNKMKRPNMANVTSFCPFFKINIYIVTGVVHFAGKT